MSCNTVQTKLSAYLDGEMSGAEMLITRAHLNQCPQCQSELDGLKSVQAILRDLPLGPEPSLLLPSMINQKLIATKRNYLRAVLMIAVPAFALAIFSFTRPNVSPRSGHSVQDRDIVISRQLAKDEIFDAGNDSTSGASLVHYTNYEGH